MIEIVREALARHQPKRVAVPGANLAAVLIPLYEKDGRQHVILTKRSQLVEHHKGEISFPGGMFDQTDTDLRMTALREAYEEVGIHPDDVEVLGEVDHFHTIVSNFSISPFVGRILRTPYDWVANPEVAAVIEAPLDHLLSPEAYAREYRLSEGRQYDHITYTYDGHVVWGATAHMLHQFLGLLRGSEVSA